MDNLQSFQPHNPLIVQSDHTLLLEVHSKPQQRGS